MNTRRTYVDVEKNKWLAYAKYTDENLKNGSKRFALYNLFINKVRTHQKKAIEKKRKEKKEERIPLVALKREHKTYVQYKNAFPFFIYLHFLYFAEQFFIQSTYIVFIEFSSFDIVNAEK